MLPQYLKREDALSFDTKRMFGKGLHERLANLSVFLERHKSSDELREDPNANMVEQISYAFDHAKVGVSKVSTPALWNIDNLLRDGKDIRGRPSTKLRKPAVHIYFEEMQKGELSVIFDLDPKDFIAEGIFDMPYYTKRPINEALHVHGFREFMRWATKSTTDEWDAAMAFHIAVTLKDGLEELVRDISDYCAVDMGPELFLTGGSQGRQRIKDWQLISKQERVTAEAAHEIWDLDKRFDDFRNTWNDRRRTRVRCRKNAN